MVRVRISLAVASLLALSSLPLRSGAEPMRAVPRAVGGPDSFGYSFTDSQEAGGPTFNAIWEDISTTGTVIFGSGVDDSVSGAVGIPFQFPFYGYNYSSCYVSSNGNMHFTGPSAGYPGTTIPSSGAPNAMIAGFWADCHTGPDGHIRYAGDSNRFIIQWTSCEYYPSDNAETFTYQIKLLPSGVIYIAYQTMTANGSSNSTAIGIENETGTVGLQYCLNGSPNTIANNRVIMFANNQPPAVPASLTQSESPGGAAMPAGANSGNPVYFRGTVTDPNAGNKVGLQVEVLPAANAFLPAVTGTTVATPTNAMVNSGSVVELSMDFTGPGLGDGLYHWRARSLDDRGATSAWVEFSVGVASFHIDATPPSAPTGPFVPSSTTLQSLTAKLSVGFSWGAATDPGPVLPLNYTVETSLTGDFSAILKSSTVQTTLYTESLSVSDQTYYWRVSAVDTAGNQGPWAGPFSFKIEPQPGPEEPPKDILPCSAGVRPPGWTPIAGLLLAGVVLIRFLFRPRKLLG